MRQIVGFMAVVALLGFGSGARAEDALKLGYVDMQRAINETSEGQTAKKKLKSMFETKQKELDDKQTDLKKMKEDFDKQQSILKPDVAAKRKKELEDKFVQLQSTYVRLQKELSEKEGELMKGLVGKLQGVIAQVAATEGFTVVLEKTESSILWAKPSLDMTNEIIRRYNAGAGAGDKGAKPPAGGAATKPPAKK